MAFHANVLIVEDDNRLGGGLKRFLRSKEEFDRVEWVSTSREACEYVQVQPTDLVLLDLVMSMHDGYHFLEQLDHLPLNRTPQVMVTSSLSHQEAINKAMRLGACYYMLKPYDKESVYRHALDILDTNPHIPTTEQYKNINQKIMEIFLALGLPPHLKGYQYLREGVKLVLQQPDMIYHITKQLYPAIANTFHVTPTKVELAIRHTLEVAWHRNNEENLREVFGCEIYLKSMKPTNGEFIALVADKLSTERM